MGAESSSTLSDRQRAAAPPSPVQYVSDSGRRGLQRRQPARPIRPSSGRVIRATSPAPAMPQTPALALQPPPEFGACAAGVDSAAGVVVGVVAAVIAGVGTTVGVAAAGIAGVGTAVGVGVGVAAGMGVWVGATVGV